ncbi:hypothetical protein LY28_00987 [Ruminiclostridium sufflavum DSM 19573]|uniref:Uncharacterized protein n=1 Tax=Ruminiclostridium sufflavum DSM 19573 TaxID=1121337 RepID=A0A318XRT4_9FIRM|nr:hypothetical protein [Ruminiclostridium sufflavum]PYG89164.1 hypothetical protein LY28_00987 [Ruminiclostridium sufflavum DSM 19573]
MPEVYYYVKLEEVSDITDCGLKLSEFYDKEVIIENEKKQCFSALLNPKDDMELYGSASFCCLKLQVKSEKCFVADRFIFETVQDNNIELYYKTIIPIEKYMFGTYRLPECLITTTILPDEAYILDKRIDSPIIYSNSEELYINNILQDLRDNYAEMDNVLLYLFLDNLTVMGRLEKVENINAGMTIFKNESGKTYCIKKPDFSSFCP